MTKFRIRYMILILVVFIFSTNLTACALYLTQQENDAATAFGDVLNVLPAEEKDGWFQLSVPDGDAKFVFSNDCAYLAVDAIPFIAAGLDVTSDCVSETIFFKKDLGLWLPSWDMLNQNCKDTAFEQFKADVKYLSKYMEYNDDTGRYSIDFDNARFEWAKDMTQNEHDIVFILNSETLITAGVEPEKVDGWEYVQFSTEINRETEKVWVFQKSIDLR